MQVYILMQSAGAPAGPFGQAAQNADERRRQCAGRRSG